MLLLNSKQCINVYESINKIMNIEGGKGKKIKERARKEKYQMKFKFDARQHDCIE